MSLPSYYIGRWYCAHTNTPTSNYVMFFSREEVIAHIQNTVARADEVREWCLINYNAHVGHYYGMSYASDGHFLNPPNAFQL